MSETVQQVKEQVMNLARRPTTSAPDDTDDESDKDDYILLNVILSGQQKLRAATAKNIAKKSMNSV
ncbi:hypothetical protein H5410_022506, partial [Solanum commersonii]